MTDPTIKLFGLSFWYGLVDAVGWLIPLAFAYFVTTEDSPTTQLSGRPGTGRSAGWLGSSF